MDEEEQRCIVAFRHTFDGVNGERVLKYLDRFCRTDEDLFTQDIRQNDYLQGRRSVMLEIRKQLKKELENV